MYPCTGLKKWWQLTASSPVILGTMQVAVHAPKALLVGRCCAEKRALSSPVGCSAPWTGSSKPIWVCVLPLLHPSPTSL